MMQKDSKNFGGAMFYTSTSVSHFAGISVGIGTLFTTQAIMGSLAAPNKHVVQMLECIPTRWMDSI